MVSSSVPTRSRIVCHINALQGWFLIVQVFLAVHMEWQFGADAIPKGFLHDSVAFCPECQVVTPWAFFAPCAGWDHGASRQAYSLLPQKYQLASMPFGKHGELHRQCSFWYSPACPNRLLLITRHLLMGNSKLRWYRCYMDIQSVWIIVTQVMPCHAAKSVAILPYSHGNYQTTSCWAMDAVESAHATPKPSNKSSLVV